MMLAMDTSTVGHSYICEIAKKKIKEGGSTGGVRKRSERRPRKSAKVVRVVGNL